MSESNRVNSLKSIYSRITSIQPAIDELANIGINVRDSAGEMRRVEDILDDLGAKWSSLSAEQQQNLGIQIAGRYQLSRFLILMEQYDTALKSTNTALNSSGSGYRENAEYLKSYEAQINMVKNAWTEAVIAMRDSGLGDAMVLTLSAGVELFKLLTSIIDTIGVLPTLVAGVGIVLLVLSERFRTLNASMASSGTRAFKWSSDIVKSVKTSELSVAQWSKSVARNMGLVEVSANKASTAIQKASAPQPAPFPTQATGSLGKLGDNKNIGQPAPFPTQATGELGKLTDN